MPQPEVFQSLFALETQLGANWSNLHAAEAATKDLHTKLSAAVNGKTREDASVVVLGSGGRFEITNGSDADWTYLIDGQANSEHQVTALEIKEAIDAILKPPGREGVFGAMAFSHDLIQYVGGEDDTNSNLTRRILLLLESKPIGRPDAYHRVLKATIDQYLSNDYGWKHFSTGGVSRFLVNDVSRYWRTVAVDFAYKRKSRNNEGWALRSAKLRLPRKLTFVAGLLYCYSIAQSVWHDAPDKDAPTRKQETIEHLWQLTSTTPLDLLADAFSRSKTMEATAKRTFDAYDRFLAILNSPADRDRLKKLTPDDASGDAGYQEIRELGTVFQAGLNELFLIDNDTPFPALTREYGMF